MIADATLLVRCAITPCRITYASAIKLREHGNPQSGLWLDEVYNHILKPLDYPDLTLLVVNKSTGKPSAEAFHDGRMKMSGIRPDQVRDEQHRAASFSGYRELFGDLEKIRPELRHSKIASSRDIEVEEALGRAVRNALNRIQQGGSKVSKVSKVYPDSLTADDLLALARHLMRKQGQRCVLTGVVFDEASEVDRVSLDRIDNEKGYSDGNVQLVTVFANRARGTLTIDEARQRLVQTNSPDTN